MYITGQNGTWILVEIKGWTSTFKNIKTRKYKEIDTRKLDLMIEKGQVVVTYQI